MIFKKCKYALKYTKNHFEIYRTVLNISQKYKKNDFPRNKNYKNAQTIPRLKAGLGIRGLIVVTIVHNHYQIFFRIMYSTSINLPLDAIRHTIFLRFTFSDFSRIEASATLVDAESRKTAKAFNSLARYSRVELNGKRMANFTIKTECLNGKMCYLFV